MLCKVVVSNNDVVSNKDGESNTGPSIAINDWKFKVRFAVVITGMEVLPGVCCVLIPIMSGLCKSQYREARPP
jgi:hypothetical protein